jgi:hypothetical protein
MALAITSVPAASADAATGRWSIIDSPNAGRYNGLNGVVRLSASDAWAVGGWSDHLLNHYHALIAHFDGRSWTSVAPPDTPDPSASLFGVVASSDRDVWAVGTQGNNDLHHPTCKPLIEHFDGISWSVSSVPRVRGCAYLNAVSASSPSDAWAVGTVTQEPPHTYRPLAMHWDGFAWSSVPTATTGSRDVFLNGVVQTSATDAWIAGWYWLHHRSYSLVEHWDGSAWTIVNVPQAGPDDMLSAISAVSATDAWAVGGSNTDPEGIIPVALHWDGSSWSLVPVPKPRSGILLKAVSAAATDDVWAVGDFGRRIATPLFEHWDGSSWSRVAASKPPRGVFGLVALSAGVDGAIAVGNRSPDPHGNQDRTLIEMCCS